MRVVSRARGAVRRARYLASGRLRRFPMESITNEFAFSLGDRGWNYIRALVAEYDRNPDLQLEKSTFFRFFHHQQVQSVRSLNDLLFMHNPKRRDSQEFQFYLGTYPWGDHVGGGPWGRHHDEVEGTQTRDLYGYRSNVWYEPGDQHALRLEWEATRRLFDSIKAGYKPVRHARLPEVTLLVRRDGSFRAMRYDGQHRLAILAHLGHQSVRALVPHRRTIAASVDEWPTVSPFPKVITRGEIVIREQEARDWLYVREGLCSVEQALEIFHAFFELNGRERVEALGLPAVY
jgi:hypothetical protein